MSNSKEKAKELQEWSAQLDRVDELVHTREELLAYSPPRSRFNQTEFNSRSYISPHFCTLPITCFRSTHLSARYVITASRVTLVPLWARCNDEDRLDEADVVDPHFIASALQVNFRWFCQAFSSLDFRPRSLLLFLQLLKPWHPAFGIKFSHNQFFVMFEHWQPPARLRSDIKRDILLRRARPYFQSCAKIVAARAADNDASEHDWFKAAAEAVEMGAPHCVRTMFHDGAAYDLRMQRAVSAIVAVAL